jgi:hypothetical protein
VPAKRTSKKDAVEPSAPADPKAAHQPADAKPDEEPVTPPLNRAERRAKGKRAAPPPAREPVIRSGGRGPTPSPRQWANRRSG